MYSQRIIIVSAILVSFLNVTQAYADAPYTLQTTETYEEQEYNQQEYQADYAQFIQMYSNIDQQSITAVSINNDQLSEKEINRVIRGIQAVSNQARKLNFKTAEGQQVQKDFIANNDFSIQGFKYHNQLAKNKSLQKKLSNQTGELEQRLTQSLTELSQLAGQ